MPLFDNFSRPSWRAVTSAQASAVRMRHAYCGGPHLLLGIAEASPSLNRTLILLEASPGAIAEALILLEGEGRYDRPGRVPLTQECKNVFGRADEERLALHLPYIEPEHLLLGLIHEEGEGWRILHGLEVDTYALEQDVRAMIGLAGACRV